MATIQGSRPSLRLPPTRAPTPLSWRCPRSLASLRRTALWRRCVVFLSSAFACLELETHICIILILRSRSPAIVEARAPPAFKAAIASAAAFTSTPLLETPATLTCSPLPKVVPKTFRIDSSRRRRKRNRQVPSQRRLHQRRQAVRQPHRCMLSGGVKRRWRM